MLAEHDTADSTPVVVDSEELARQAWPDGAEPIGKRIKQGPPEDASNPWMTVVGVVKNVKEDRFNFRIDRPVWYVPLDQHPALNQVALVVAAEADPTSLIASVRDAIHSVDPEQPVSNITTMKSVVAETLLTERFSAVLMAALAALGLALAAIGLYGMIAYSVGQRRGEMGLRMALGATRRDLLWLVIRQGMKPVLLGTTIGVICSLVISIVLNSRLASKGAADLLFGVSPFDPLTYAGVCGFLAAVALLAILVPAQRAARVDPIIALRSE